MAKTSYIPWRERACVSLDEAGQIVARSPLWVRRQIMWGVIDAVRVMPGSPISVSVPSLIEFIETVETVAPESVVAGPPKLSIVRNT